MLYLSCLKGINRKTGKVVTIAERISVSGGDAAGEVLELYRDLMDPEKGAEDREKLSGAILIVDNSVRNQHEFPDLVKLAESDAAKAKRAAAETERNQKAQDVDALRRKLAQEEESLRLSDSHVVNLGGVSLEQGGAPVAKKQTSKKTKVAQAAKGNEQTGS